MPNLSVIDTLTDEARTCLCRVYEWLHVGRPDRTERPKDQPPLPERWHVDTVRRLPGYILHADLIDAGLTKGEIERTETLLIGLGLIQIDRSEREIMSGGWVLRTGHILTASFHHPVPIDGQPGAVSYRVTVEVTKARPAKAMKKTQTRKAKAKPKKSDVIFRAEWTDTDKPGQPAADMKVGWCVVLTSDGLAVAQAARIRHAADRLDHNGHKIIQAIRNAEPERPNIGQIANVTGLDYRTLRKAWLVPLMEVGLVRELDKPKRYELTDLGRAASETLAEDQAKAKAEILQ